MSYTRHGGETVEPAKTEPYNSPTNATRVFLVDDHEVVRRGLIRLLRTEPDLDVVGEAGSYAESMSKIPSVTPDVAVLDIQLPDGSGIDLCRELRALLPTMKCLMLTSSASDQSTLEAIQAGASGYIVKDIKGLTLAQSIRDAGAGKSLFDPATEPALTEKLRIEAERANPFAGLSNQEKTVLELLAEGLTNKEIAVRMDLSEKTVKNYVSRVFLKLGMERRIQAAVLVSGLTASGHNPTPKPPVTKPAPKD